MSRRRWANCRSASTSALATTTVHGRPVAEATRRVSGDASGDLSP